MSDIFVYVWLAFKKPFHSRVFKITFIAFIPTSTFGIYYQLITKRDVQWDSVFTPESFLTYLIPLFSSVALEGLMLAINRATEMEKSTAEFEVFRDSMLVAFVFVLLLTVIIYISVIFNHLWLSVVSTMILWFMWIILCSAKADFGPTKKWSPTGNASTRTAKDIVDAKG